MAWLAVDSNGDEYIFQKKPFRDSLSYEVLNRDVIPVNSIFWNDNDATGIKLLKGSIEKLIDRKINWKDEPIKYGDDEY